MTAQPDIQSLIRQVNASNLSSIRTVVVKLLAVISDPTVTAKDLVQIIHTDPPLAAKVLKLVNSAHCSPVSKISDLQQAVIFIGFEALKELALSQKVCEIFQHSMPINGYSRKALWRHSLAVALCAKQIYRKEFREKGEAAYASGLLHDLGIIVEDQFCNDAFQDLLATASHRRIELRTAEKERLGFDHAELGMRLLENWQLPEILTATIGNHHRPDTVSGGGFQLAATVFIANFYCQQESMGYCKAHVQDDAMADFCLAKLDIQSHAMDLIMGNVKDKIAAMEAQGLI